MKETAIRLFSCLLAAALLLSMAPALAESGYTAPDYEWKFIKKVPMKPKYTEDVENHGTVETLRYTTHAYALEAVEKYGAWKGGWLALRRILRCNPFHKQNGIEYDPVP